MQRYLDDLKDFLSRHLSGRLTQHLFDPVTLVGGVAVLILLLILLSLALG